MFMLKRNFFFIIFSFNAFSMGIFEFNGYSGSTHSLQTFKNRLDELERDGTIPELLR